MNPRITTRFAISLLLIACIVALYKHKENAGLPANPSTTTNSSGRAELPDYPAISNGAGRERILPNRIEKRANAMEAHRIGRNFMVSTWLKCAASAFAKTSQSLALELNLSAKQTAEVDSLFASRKEHLAGMLASLTANETEDPHEALRQITALVRNKGLRTDLAGILSSEQLATFDAAEANRQREAIETKTHSDMAAVNAVLTLTASQKPVVLAALSARAAEKVEEEADARAIMSLSYGEMAAVIDLSNVRGLAGALNENLDDVPDFAYGSTEYHRWMENQRAERIERELSPLRHILDDNQFVLYREYLEAKSPR